MVYLCEDLGIFRLGYFVRTMKKQLNGITLDTLAKCCQDLKQVGQGYAPGVASPPWRQHNLDSPAGNGVLSRHHDHTGTLGLGRLRFYISDHSGNYARDGDEYAEWQGVSDHNHNNVESLVAANDALK